MAKLVINRQKLNQKLETILYRFSQEVFKANDRVIRTPRLWEDWETSDPFRDIVDSKDLANSGKIYKAGKLKYEIKWSTPYILYVYFGYMLQDGRRIPARKWIDIAKQENNYHQILRMVIKTSK
jgi:hypothetical protein